MTRWLALAAATGTVLVLLVLWPERAAPPGPLPPELADRPDVYLVAPRIEAFDEAGRLRWAVRARTAAHFPPGARRDGHEATTFEAPRVRLRDRDGLAWTLLSRSGQTLPGTDPETGAPRPEALIELTGDVLAVRTGPGADFTRIQGEHMILDPERRTVRSDTPVIIDSASGRSTAANLDGALGAGLLDLGSSADQRVRTIVLPGGLL